MSDPSSVPDDRSAASRDPSPASFRYERTLAAGASLTAFVVASRALRGNPLGDPHVRANPLLVPAGGGEGLPLVLILPGFTGFGHKVLNRPGLWGETLAERIARLLACGAVPPAVFLWPSCETRWGGSQYMNSAGTGRYEDYILADIVPAVEAVLRCGGAGRRAVAGKSSGGYGALRLAMRNPGFFSAAASHSGDIGFDLSHRKGFPDALTCWHRYGGVEAFVAKLPELRLGDREHAGIECIAMASCYSPNPSAPLGVDLPVDPETGEPREDVFARWIAQDPLRMIDGEGAAEALAGLRALFLDAGETDEFGLQWGLRRFVAKLRAKGIGHRAAFFEGGHFDTDARYETSLPLIVGALAGGEGPAA